MPGGGQEGAPNPQPHPGGLCSPQTKDWWTYEFCYGRHIQQYHLEGDTGDSGRDGVALVTFPPKICPLCLHSSQSLRSRVTCSSSAITSPPSTGTMRRPRSVSRPCLGDSRWQGKRVGARGRWQAQGCPRAHPAPPSIPPGLQAAPAEALPQPELRERLPLRPDRPRPRGRGPGKRRRQRGVQVTPGGTRGEGRVSPGAVPAVPVRGGRRGLHRSRGRAAVVLVRADGAHDANLPPPVPAARAGAGPAAHPLPARPGTRTVRAVRAGTSL